MPSQIVCVIDGSSVHLHSGIQSPAIQVWFVVQVVVVGVPVVIHCSVFLVQDPLAQVEGPHTCFVCVCVLCVDVLVQVLFSRVSVVVVHSQRGGSTHSPALHILLF